MVTSRGDASLIQQAKRYLTNIFIGLVIVFAAWFIVDTVGEYLLDIQRVSVWNVLTCVEQPEFITEQLRPLDAVEIELVGRVYTPEAPDIDFHLQPALRDSADCNPQSWVPGMACYAYGRCAEAISDSTIASSCSRIRAFQTMIANAATQYNVPAGVLAAIMIVESSGNPNARSGVGAIGLMQVMPGTARTVCGISNANSLFDPQTNINCGAQVIATELGRFNNLNLAFAAYNGGSGSNGMSSRCTGDPNLRSWQCPFSSSGCCVNNVITGTNCGYVTGENTWFVQTRIYVEKVNRALSCYQNNQL
jgi:hypothetical protein